MAIAAFPQPFAGIYTSSPRSLGPLARQGCYRHAPVTIDELRARRAAEYSHIDAAQLPGSLLAYGVGLVMDAGFFADNSFPAHEDFYSPPHCSTPRRNASPRQGWGYSDRYKVHDRHYQESTGQGWNFTSTGIRQAAEHCHDIKPYCVPPRMDGPPGFQTHTARQTRQKEGLPEFGNNWNDNRPHASAESVAAASATKLHQGSGSATSPCSPHSPVSHTGTVMLDDEFNIATFDSIVREAGAMEFEDTVPSDRQLTLYGLRQQIEKGDAKEHDKPGMFASAQARAQWTAHDRHRGKGIKECRMEYVSEWEKQKLEFAASAGKAKKGTKKHKSNCC